MSLNKKIVLTGAPSTGKSSVMKELANLYGLQVLLVPESAVVLLSGGYPPPQHTDVEQIRHFQKAILTVQAGLEFSLPRQNPQATFAVFDRASLDGAGFWPPGPEDYFNQYRVNREKEYAKFDHVLFLDLPTSEMFGGTNAHRFHNFEQSLASQAQLEAVWKDHPSFKKIPSSLTLEDKIQTVLAEIKTLIE